MFNLIRRTQQWSVYPLISCFVGIWLLVVCQLCVASTDAVVESTELDGITSPCKQPVTNENDELTCCNVTSSCGDMALMADTSFSLPMMTELSSFDFPVFAINLSSQYKVPQITSTCSLYQDPESANILPIERFCVQLK